MKSLERARGDPLGETWRGRAIKTETHHEPCHRLTRGQESAFLTRAGDHGTGGDEPLASYG